MPALPSWLTEPLWDQFAALLPDREHAPIRAGCYRASSAGLVAYAIWAGLGVALVATIGVLFLGESMNWIKGGSLALIIIGVVGLNLVSAEA